MTARLDRLLQHLGRDVVVQSQPAVPHEHPQPRLRAARGRPADVTDVYERHVFGALKTVSPEEREYIELTYFDGLSVQEIAARCGRSIQVVEGRRRHGLEDMLGYLRARE